MYEVIGLSPLKISVNTDKIFSCAFITQYYILLTSKVAKVKTVQRFAALRCQLIFIYTLPAEIEYVVISSGKKLVFIQ